MGKEIILTLSPQNLLKQLKRKEDLDVSRLDGIPSLSYMRSFSGSILTFGL